MRTAKMIRRLVFGVAYSALLVSSVAAQAAPPARTGARVDVTRATLANGLHVIVLRDPLAPVVSTYMNYETGSDDEPITGLAHAQEHMMFRGSRTLSASQFADVTAITGGSFDADTQNNVTQFFFTMPSKDLDIALHLEASRAQGILDTQPLWDQERGAIEQEVQRDNSDASYRLYVKALAHLMAGTPYADAGLGTMESFGHQIQAPQLQRFYRTWYHPNNAIFVIAGDVDPQTTLAKVRALFGALPSRPIPAARSVRLAPLSPATFTDVSDAATTQAFLAYRFPGYASPDYAASQILIDVLDSQRGNLYGLVARGKAVDASAQAQPFTHAGIAIVGDSVTPNVDVRTALAQIRAVVEGYRRTGVPADLVAAAKQQELAQAQFQASSIEGLAGEWSQAEAVEHRTPDADLRAIRKVTVAEVDRVLREYLDDATATSAYAVPKNVRAGGGGSASVATGLAGSAENNTVVPTGPVTLPAWARSVLSDLRVPPDATNPVVSTLPNGLRLIVQPESVTKSVLLAGAIRNDPQVEEAPDQEGVASVTSELLPYGTTTYGRLAYQRQLDAIAASVSTGTGFSLAVLASHFDRGVQLLADDELHPALPASMFAVVKAQASQSIAGAQSSPGYQAAKAMVTALYPRGDPLTRFATPQSVRALTLADAKAWYAKAYRPDLTTIVVVGDVTPQQARVAVVRWFGGWKARGPRPNVDLAPVPNNAPASFAIPATGRIQSSVTLSETVRLRRGDPGVAPMRVADAILSGGFYASMLFQDLRERTGLVYSVGTSLQTGRSRSTFSLRFGCAPANVARAEVLALADLRRLRDGPVDAARLRVAKALLLGGLPVSQDSYDGIASTLLSASIDGVPLDQERVDAARELTTSAASVQAALRRYVRLGGFVRVVEGPPAVRRP